MSPVLEIRGVKIPVTRWAVSGLSLLVLVAGSIAIYRYLWDRHDGELTTLTEANGRLKTEMAAYDAHFQEAPISTASLLDDARSLLTVGAFTDECLLIRRRAGVNGATTTKLIPARAHDPLPSETVRAPRDDLHLFTVFADQDQCRGRCLNPHPAGKFRSWYGERHGCIVEVWREFADGCRHSQLFDACSGAWATNEDGSPRVRWTCCRH